MRILIVNGPNLNLLGERKPEVYGTEDFATVLARLRKDFPGVLIEYRQSNHEGDLIDFLHRGRRIYDGFVLNAGGYTHTSVALRDAVEAIAPPVVEVHWSDIDKRETFRRTSLLADVCAARFYGQGENSYRQAVKWLISHLSK